MERVIINGFFAKGNCGDEAILQTWYDLLSQKFEVVASVDGQILSGFDRNVSSLYDNINLVNNNNVSFSTDNNVRALIIGGGGLGLGFGIRQVLHARLRNKKKYYLGVTVHDEFFDGDDEFVNLNREIFKCFDLISVRDKYSESNLKEIFNINCMQFPDVAFGLQHEKIDLKTSKKYVTVTLRDYGNNDLEILKKWLRKIEEFARKSDFEIIYLPFDQGDENLLNKLGIKNLYKSIFWKPKNMKYIISKSEICFSLGRFHPIVFALSESVTPYYIDVKSEREGINKFDMKNRDKCFYIMIDNDLPENYLVNSDIDSVEFDKSNKVELISAKLTSEISKFKEMLLKEIST